MPLQQEDIRSHYEREWGSMNTDAIAASGMEYSSPVEDAVLYPAYLQLIRELQLRPDASMLDVGSGSGRWVRFFLRHFNPARLLGVDFTQASVDLLKRHHASANTQFEKVDITDASLDLGERFDFINVANVLFHIPELDRYRRAMTNLAKHLKPDGRIVTTEYLPRISMRTEWMMVRSRYEFEALAHEAGLKIVAMRGFCFFSNDPMGIDGPDSGPRRHFAFVKAAVNELIRTNPDPRGREFLTHLFAEIERGCVTWARERVAETDLPSQKLVVLGKA